ncbi:hypothetical protein BAE44_0022457 [Dichanthelium oligosanthes]|uniref:F-box associated beta-propeller type 3 domain-containing protein n=1 Tax=Dichanthelium oligosanthes TaxID=888268 RepID=A0A1E5UUN6_9POAL|nr:hypothetical protein BAE44_0022457 [Dichanthelium oligosanthes]
MAPHRHCKHFIAGVGLIIDSGSGVVVDGVVYFFISGAYNCAFLTGTGKLPDIASFDLGREEWSRDLQAPMGHNIGSVENFHSPMYQHTLAEFKGSLVLVYKRRQQSTFVMDLWFLTDLEKGVWVKEYAIRTEWINLDTSSADFYQVEPILMLDDGRLVLHLTMAGILLIWDPRSNNFAQLEIRDLNSVAIYTGSLLSLQ